MLFCVIYLIRKDRARQPRKQFCRDPSPRKEGRAGVTKSFTSEGHGEIVYLINYLCHSERSVWSWTSMPVVVGPMKKIGLTFGRLCLSRGKPRVR